jgi:N-methylhydantoinase B
VDQFRFNDVQPAGIGRYRGGLGLVRDYRILSTEADLTATFGRFKYPPWGADGGGDGSANAIEIIPEGKSEPILRRGKVARYRLQRGDVARLVTGVGGGYGDPMERDPDVVLEDVRNEVLTLTQAAEIYGVVIVPETHAVDIRATQALRKQYSTTFTGPER